MNRRPIGVFDSGSGGLTVIKQVRELLPNEDILYLGDTARLPYGSRSRDEIILFNRQIISFLISRGAKIIIMGCNTSSALALDWARQNFQIPIVGLIGPGAQAACAVSPSKNIGIIATQATVKAQAYRRAILGQEPEARISESACPHFVPLIESGLIEGPQIEALAREYLAPLLATGVDTIIYGCTHYPLLNKALAIIVGPKINWVDPARQAVREADKLMRQKQILQEGNQPGQTTCFLTGPSQTFQVLASLVLGPDQVKITKVSISELEKAAL